MPPRITVVVPAWDIDRELRECVASVRSQDEPALVVVVDNASTTRLPGLDATYVRLDERVSVGAARNAGLAVAQTDLVMFLDADDVLLAGALRYLRQELDKHPDVVALSGAMVAWNPNSDVRRPKRWPFPYAYRLQRWPTTFALVNAVRALFPVTGPTLMRADVARRTGGFCDADWGEDWCFGAALGFAGPVVMVRRECMLYRIDPTRVSLSDLKERRWAPSWQGRRAVRRNLRASPGVPRWTRLVSYLLPPFHLFFVLEDLFVARQRV